MIVHEAVGVDDDTIAVFIFEEEVVVELFGPSLFKEPVLVMALPGDMEGGAIFNNVATREGRHNREQSKSHAKA